MQYQANSPEDYISQLPEDRKEPIIKLRKTINKNLPKGFEETISYGMIGYVVPHTIYPAGYHYTPELPLPFMYIASQKNFIAVYSSSVYATKELYNWFVSEYPKHCKRKLDMGKSCIRFKYIDDIPYELIGELASKMTVEEWINIYEKNIKK
ncbi:DUF1801 domain-containing protein [Mariniflexile gromovii]|uniref:DUF1801 domain-containing protein n=1 Tax=Mariniflexile gromovii TaxID=362523 RepID=A0ABS4BXK0_9FLAO|nr:DUF1801 domain-containing protein [Mariniflexile gromovii]MBP0904752.1 DUF1801 domain-containing protein [Mariniflexile gromovii]